jgi:hypothetical protein
MVDVRGRSSQSARSRRWRFALLAAAAAGVVIATFAIRRPAPEGRPDAPPLEPDRLPVVSDAPTAAESGGTLDCRRLPDFVAELGFSGLATFSTAEASEGLVLLDPADPSASFQHPSWAEHGWLGPFTYDASGNLYVAPTPRTDQFTNPPGEATTIFKVDTATAVMSPLTTLPAAGPPATDNPFGILELTFDCETSTLYASSVAGSTREREVGEVVQLDPVSGEILDSLRGLDAVGLGVFLGPHGRRLYIGAARRPEISSVPLSADGRFAGPARQELNLPVTRQRPGEIRFDAPGRMTVVGAPFDFTLAGMASDASARYTYAYVPQTDSWVLETSALDAR